MTNYPNSYIITNNMITNALIKIKDSKNAESVIVAEGIVRRENDAFYIEYETDVDKYVIGISGDIVTVSRIAAESYTMVMQQDKPHKFDVDTQFGTVKLSMTPTKVRHKQHEKGLDLHLEYTIKTTAGSEEETQAFRMSIKCIYK